MSHLETATQTDMVFKKNDHARLTVALNIGYLMLIGALALGGVLLFGTFGTLVYWTLAGLLGLLLAGGVTMVIMNRWKVMEMREIRDALGALVKELNFQFSNRLENGQSHVFSTLEHGLIKATRRGDHWAIQSYRPGDSIEMMPLFEAVVMYYRMSDVHVPGVLLAHTPYNLAWLKRVHAVIASECQAAALFELMPAQGTEVPSERIEHDGVDELERLTQS